MPTIPAKGEHCGIRIIGIRVRIVCLRCQQFVHAYCNTICRRDSVSDQVV